MRKVRIHETRLPFKTFEDALVENNSMEFMETTLRGEGLKIEAEVPSAQRFMRCLEPQLLNAVYKNVVNLFPLFFYLDHIPQISQGLTAGIKGGRVYLRVAGGRCLARFFFANSFSY